MAGHAGVSFPATVAVEVVERMPGGLATAFAAPECRRPFPQITAAAERAPVTPAAARRLAGLVTAAWAIFDEIAAASPAGLRKGPRGGGRDRDQIIEHVLGADTAYARKLGIKLKPPSLGDNSPITQLREAIAAALSAPSRSGVRIPGPLPGDGRRATVLTLTLGEPAHSPCRAGPAARESTVEEISIGEFARRSRLSLKALRLYDKRGVLVPSRVDRASGYRYYDPAQLDAARLVVMMRQLQLPLAAIKKLLACDPADAAERIAAHWQEVESAHDARRDLADYLVSRLRGKRPVMYEVAVREMPERSLLCLKRNVDERGQWAFGKEFIGIMRERPLPKIEGREGAVFCIQWGWVSPDSDGPVEWCKPVPQAEAHALAESYPELTLRAEPAHGEVFVPLPADYGLAQWQLAIESIQAWEQEHGDEDERLALTPEDLGMRITYLATGPVTAPVSDCDFALPFVLEQ